MNGRQDCVEDHDGVSQREVDHLHTRYRSLLETMAAEKDDEEDESLGVTETLCKADKLFEEVDNTRLCVLDAQLVDRVSDFCVQSARSHNTNVQTFDPWDFASKIASFVEARSYGEEERRFDLGAENWIKLGEETHILFPRCPSLTYLNGSIDKFEVETIPKKRRAVRASKGENVVSTQSVLVSNSDAISKTDQTEVLVESTFKQLVREFKKSDRRPVNYFSFVLDPRSFSNSVENIFHVSFLVHENKVALISDKETPPFLFIHPVRQKRKDDEYRDEIRLPKYQSVISIQMEEWASLIEYFNIREPLINHHQTFLKEDAERKRQKTIAGPGHPLTDI